MSRVILHIGTHKTATTTIQDTFHKNADLLQEHGVIYPRFEKHTGHHGLVAAWGNLPKTYNLPKGSLGTLAALAKSYAGTDQTLFLSSEEFSRGNPEAAVDWAAIRDVLAPFDKVEIVCLLRTQWQFIQSIYLEVSKLRTPPRPWVLADRAIETGMCEGLWIDYNGLLDQLEGHFEPDALQFLNFHDMRNQTGGVLRGMLDHLGLQGLDLDALAPVNEGKSNVSPMALAGWAGNTIAEPHVAPPWLLQKIEEAFGTQFPDGFKPCLFTRAEFERLAKHFNARNDVFEQRLSDMGQGINLPKIEKGGLTLFRDQIPGEFWIRTSRRLAVDRLREGK